MTKQKTAKNRQGTKGLPEKRGAEMERAQIWSIDVLLAVVIFISIMIIFYVTITSNQKPTLRDLQSEAGFLKVELETNKDYSFIEGDTINNTRLSKFVNDTTKNYDAVKEKLGVRGDFCIYFEDEAGHIILLQNDTNANLTGVGKGDINISDTPCGSNYNW